MAKKKTTFSKIKAWILWPYEIYRKIKQWILRTATWKRLEAMEYDPPPYPLTWWITRGVALILVLLTTHYWSYWQGRTDSALSRGSIVGFVTPTSEKASVRAAKAEAKRWKDLAHRVGTDNHQLYKSLNQMQREIAALRAKAGEKANLAAVVPSKKKPVKKYYKPKPKVKAKAKTSSWLNPY